MITTKPRSIKGLQIRCHQSTKSDVQHETVFLFLVSNSPNFENMLPCEDVKLPLDYWGWGWGVIGAIQICHLHLYTQGSPAILLQ